MSTSFSACAAYAIAIPLQEAYERMRSSPEFIDALWDSLEPHTKECFRSKDEVINSDNVGFDTIDTFIYSKFPLLKAVWVGNPYSTRVPEQLLVAVKKTSRSSSGEPLVMPEDVMRTKEERKSLRDFCALARIDYNPQWRLWLEIS